MRFQCYIIIVIELYGLMLNGKIKFIDEIIKI